MGYDEVIVQLGDFGRYQKIIFLLIALTSIPVAFHKLASVFLFVQPDFRCALPTDPPNGSYELTPPELKEIAYPTGDHCRYYDVQVNNNGSYYRVSEVEHSCSRYIYDRSKYDGISVVSDFDLVCSRQFLVPNSDSMFMLGVLLGSFIFGQLSDKYGRKPIFFASLVIQVIFGVAAGLAPEYFSFILARLVVGATTSGVFLVAYVIAMEMVGPSKRLYAGIFVMMFFSVGYMLTGIFGHYIHYWRWLQIALTLPGLIFMCYYWIIPESVRWLLSKGRKKQAVEVIQRAARFNRVEITNEALLVLLDEDGSCEQDPKLEEKPEQAADEKAPSMWDLLRYPNLRRKTLIIFYDWLVCTGVYYGLSWGTSLLGGDPLWTFVFSGAVELPAYCLLLLTLNRWGRRSILCGCMLVSGISLLLTIVVPRDANWLNIVCFMVAKLAITGSYGTIYLFSSEQFPTVVRNVGMGVASMVSRLTGMLASYVNALKVVWPPLPLVLYGTMALTAGILSLMLPETLNQPTLETIEDGERFGKKQRGGDAYLETGRELCETPAETEPLKGNGHKV